MHPLTSAAVCAATVNATRSEIKAITFPRAFDDIDWSQLDFFGWRDPRIERRGYLVTERADALVTLVLTTPGTRRSGGRKAMCSICHAVDDGSHVSLFVARRAGSAGRKGDGVGTYICDGLDCSAQLRSPDVRAGRTVMADNHESVDARAAAMLERLDAFVASVTTPS